MVKLATVENVTVVGSELSCFSLLPVAVLPVLYCCAVLCCRAAAGLRLPVLAVLRRAGGGAGRWGRRQRTSRAAARALRWPRGEATHRQTDPAAGAAHWRVRVHWRRDALFTGENESLWRAIDGWERESVTRYCRVRMRVCDALLTGENESLWPAIDAWERESVTRYWRVPARPVEILLQRRWRRFWRDGTGRWRARTVLSMTGTALTGAVRTTL